MKKMLRAAAPGALALILAACSSTPQGPGGPTDIAVSANETKVFLDNGTVRVRPSGARDSITVLDLSASPPKVIGEVNVPTSVVGPPMSVAIAPDLSYALVTSATQISPQDAQKVVDANRLSVIDLAQNPPRVVQTLEAGAGAAGVDINAAGTLALVANRSEGTVSVYTIRAKQLTPAGKVSLGDARSGPSTVRFAPDGKTALVTRDGDNTLSLLAIDGAQVQSAKRDFHAGLRPYGADISADGSYAAVANIGRGQGDADTVSLVDLRMIPPRTVDTITVGPTPEGLIFSPDGRHIAVVVHNGSARAAGTPLFNPTGRLVMLRVDVGGKLTRVAEAPIGRWSQGVAFMRDGRTVLVQNMVEEDIQLFRFNGRDLTDTGARVKLPGGGAALRAAYR